MSENESKNQIKIIPLLLRKLVSNILFGIQDQIRLKKSPFYPSQDVPSQNLIAIESSIMKYGLQSTIESIFLLNAQKIQEEFENSINKDGESIDQQSFVPFVHFSIKNYENEIGILNIEKFHFQLSQSQQYQILDAINRIIQNALQNENFFTLLVFLQTLVELSMSFEEFVRNLAIKMLMKIKKLVSKTSSQEKIITQLRYQKFASLIYDEIYNMQYWVQDLREATFETHVFPLSNYQIKTLIELCQIFFEQFNRQQNNQKSIQMEIQDETYLTKPIKQIPQRFRNLAQIRKDNIKEQSTNQQIQVSDGHFQTFSGDDAYKFIQQNIDNYSKQNKEFQILVQALDEFLENLHKQNLDAEKQRISFFIQLSTRSPKDSFLLGKQKFCSLENEKKSQITEEVKSDTLEQASIEGLKILNALDSIKLLCSSMRVYDDLMAISQSFDENPDDVNTNAISIIFRPWHMFPSWAEFRGFVCQWQLTAVSVYYQSNVKIEVVKNKNLIGQKMLQFYNEKVKNNLNSNYQHVVLDLVLIFQDQNFENWQPENLSVKLIELNPFGQSSSSALFSWTEDSDIIYGRQPFEIRVPEIF